MADQSQHVCSRTSNDKRQFAATPCVSLSRRLSTCRSLLERRKHGYTLTFYLVAYCMMQCTRTIVNTKAHARATVECLLRKLAEKVRR